MTDRDSLAAPLSGAADANMAAPLAPGTAEYETHVQEEIEHFSSLFDSEDARSTLFYYVPPVWNEIERRAGEHIRAHTGNDLPGHLVQRLQSVAGARMLSLGSGPGGLEMTVVAQAPGAGVDCLDINEELLALGRAQARERGLAVEFARADLNTVVLPAQTYDVILCHAVLHHLLALEHVAEQIGQALRPGGELVVVDIITRVGYRMWPETREVVDHLFRVLPARYRVNHTGYAEPRVDDVIWEADTSAHGMECVRSEDIVRVLSERFTPVHYVPYFSICRRFFDTMYGPNYDLDRPLDRAIVEWLWQMDRHYLESGTLRPETFFGVYRAP